MIANDNNMRRKTQLTPVPMPPFAMRSGQAIYGNTTMVVATLQPIGETGQSTNNTFPPGDQPSTPPWMTVKGLAKKYNGIITEAALRNLIWNAEAYAKYPKSGLTSNHFLPVIVRPPNQRKVLLDFFEFEKWLTGNCRMTTTRLPTVSPSR